MNEQTLQDVHCIKCGIDLGPFESFGLPHFDSSEGPICYSHLEDEADVSYLENEKDVS